MVRQYDREDPATVNNNIFLPKGQERLEELENRFYDRMDSTLEQTLRNVFAPIMEDLQPGGEVPPAVETISVHIPGTVGIKEVVALMQFFDSGPYTGPVEYYITRNGQS